MKKILVLLILFMVIGLGGYLYMIKNKKDTIKIVIGYQTQCSQTWGSLVIKNQKLIEKNLQKDFPNSKIDVVWEDSPSGPPITNNMIAGKTQVGFFGDMPLLVNGSKGQTMENYDSIFIAMDGKGKAGKNQAIVVNKDDANATVADLAGKTVSTPFGSSAHRMLLSILEKNNLTDKVDIINQDVTTGLISVETKKIYATATWDPYPRQMVERGKSAYLVDGKESGVDYLNGVVVNKRWAEANPRQAIAVAKAVLEAHDYIQKNPEQAARIFSAESNFSYTVALQEAREIRWDAFLYPQDKKTLAGDVAFLKNLGKMESLDIDSYWDDKYLRTAAKELHITYPDDQTLAAGW